MSKKNHDSDVAFISALAELLRENDLTELEVMREYGEADSLTSASAAPWPPRPRRSRWPRPWPPLRHPPPQPLPPPHPPRPQPRKTPPATPAR